MRDGLPYDDWKKELKIWCGFIDLDKKRQGPALFLTLKGKARETVLAEVEADKLQADDGVDKVTNALDKLYKRNDSESAFTAFENFIKFRRHSSMSITDYIIEFNIRLSKIKSHKMDLPDGVLAYYLLQCANLTEDQTSLCRATCEKLTYENMKAQIERVSVPSVTHAHKASSQVHVEPQYVNSMWPSDAIQHHGSLSTLIQMMTCHVHSAKLPPQPMLNSGQVMNKVQWNSNQNAKIFFQSNACEKVICKFCSGLHVLTHWGRLTHICISELSHHWFR